MAEDWPTDLLPYQAEFYQRANSTVFTSPLTRSQQVLRRQGKQWICSASFNLSRTKAQRMDALLARLEGQYGTVRIWDFARPDPLGTNLDRTSIAESRFADVGPPATTTFSDGTVFSGGSAGVVVWGGHSMGDTEVLADGFPAGTTQLLQGDYVEIGQKLYMLVQDAGPSDANGRATLYLSRPLLADVAHASPVTRTRARAEMRLIDDGQPNRMIQARLLRYSYVLSFVEVL